MNEQTRYTLRLDKELHKQFLEIAKQKDENPSQLVRHFMREYVLKNRQGNLKL